MTIINDNLPQFVSSVLQNPSILVRPYVEDHDLRKSIVEACIAIRNNAVGDRTQLTRLHSVLANIYDYLFSIPDSGNNGVEVGALLADVRAALEPGLFAPFDYTENLPHATALPRKAKFYIKWLKDYISAHPASVHPVYRQFLRTQAKPADIKFFLAQETSLDPRFDDILALLQVGTRGTEKMEIASNYWDEMGNGNQANVHTHLFQRALDHLEIDDTYIAGALLFESRVCGNISAALALNPRYHYKAVGYFGVTEYLAPRRFKDLVAGWHRNGLPESGIVYHVEHIRIDAIHGNAWLNNVIGPLIEQDQGAATDIAAGARLRLESSKAYLDAIHAVLESRGTSNYARAEFPA